MSSGICLCWQLFMLGEKLKENSETSRVLLTVTLSSLNSLSRGIATGIYTTNSSEACLHILQTSRANIVVVDDDNKLQVVQTIKPDLPELKALIQIDDFGSSSFCFHFNSLYQVPTDDIEYELTRRLQSITVNECCCIVFTSGTVGHPKGVMLSHDNLNFSIQNTIKAFGNVELGKEVFVSYLPLAHCAALMADVFIAMSVGATVYFADKNALKGSLVKTLSDAQPTFFMGVPRVYEKFQEKMIAAGAQAGVFARALAAWAKKVTLQYHLDRTNGNQSISFQYQIAKFLILNKIKLAIGFQRCKSFMTGAAPLNEETRTFFTSLDMPLLEGYGMTESSSLHSMASANNASKMKPLPETQTKITNLNSAGHGEVLMKGRHVFMGYVNELDKTLETIDSDRWLHTGDIGFIDGEGFLHITGRIKELIITSGGENIPFKIIEENLKRSCPAISNAMLVGDKRKFLTILLTLKTEIDVDGSPLNDLDQTTITWLKSFGINFSKLSELLASGPDQKILTKIQESIDFVNAIAISNAQKVQRFAILPCDFSLGSGELTPTMKLKRSFVLNKYETIIENFYK